MAAKIGSVDPFTQKLWIIISLFNETHSELVRIMITCKILMPSKLSACKTKETIYRFSIGVIIYTINLKIIFITYKYLAYDLYVLFRSYDYKIVWKICCGF